MNDILAKICADKRLHIEVQKESHSLSALEKQLAALEASQKNAPRGFYKSLLKAKNAGHYGFICEIKKASPSKGLIRADFDPEAIAKAYEQGGATCLSVLTDMPYFQGADAYLKAVRAATDLPVLRKDFMLDIYQVYEARLLGADAILLIMAALSDDDAAMLENTALSLGMDCLIEIHNADELTRALKLKSPMIGINNRNLTTMAVRLETSLSLAPLIPTERLIVAESGLDSREALKACAQVGATSFLIGEYFMRQKNIAKAVQNMQK